MPGRGFAVADARGELFAVIPCLALAPAQAEASAHLLAASFDLLGTLETLVASLDEGAKPADILNYIHIQARARGIRRGAG